MRAQDLALALVVGREEERVVHLPGRVADREIERREVVVIGLDVGAFGDGKTHVRENGREFVDDLADRMDAPARLGSVAHRQRDVEALGGEALLERRVGERLLARRDRRLHLIAQAVDQGTLALALLGRHRAEGLQKLGDGALLAQRGDTHAFERGLVGRTLHLRQEIAFESRKIGHGHKSRAPAFCGRGAGPSSVAGPLAGIMRKRGEGSRRASSAPARQAACCCGSAAFACSTMAAKAAGSRMAMSDRTLRSTSMPALPRPSMKRE
jgi:hypothetical protein